MEINQENFVEKMSERLCDLHIYQKNPLTPADGEIAEGNIRILLDFAEVFGLKDEVLGKTRDKLGISTTW